VTDPAQFRVWLGLIPGGIRDKLLLIPIARCDKLPDVRPGDSWKDPRYRLTPAQALERLEAGRNVGVVGTNGTLAVLDIERENVLEAEGHLPPDLKGTLAVRTRNGGLHLYYLNAGVPNRDLIVNGRRLVEVRADWRYVLAPGSYVPSETGGDGVYRVVNRRPPLPLSPDLLPWLGEERAGPPRPVRFGGRFLSLPCVQGLFRIPLTSGRRKHGAKLVAIACLKDGLDDQQIAEVSRRYAEIQSQPKWPVSRGQVLSWSRSARRGGYEWSCGEAVSLYRSNGMLPPCGLCPLRREEDARVRP